MNFGINKSKKIVSISEVDFKSKLRFDSMFNIMQNEALIHSEKIGVGLNTYLKKGQTWVLTWAKIIVNRYPIFGEELIIHTWLKKVYKLYTLRDFTFFNINEEPVINASTGWLLLNMDTMRPIRLKEIPETVKFLENKSAINEFPQKLSINSPLNFIYKKNILYSSLDLNYHVNNSKYIEFIIDSIPISTFEKKEIESVELYFTGDAKYNDILGIYNNFSNEKEVTFFEIRNITKNKSIFKAKTVFR